MQIVHAISNIHDEGHLKRGVQFYLLVIQQILKERTIITYCDALQNALTV